MTQREKILGAAVAGVVLLFAGQMVWSNIQAGFAAKEGTIEALKKKKSDQDLASKQGIVSTQRLSKVQPRSASKKEELARATYQRWLIELADQIELEDPSELSLGGTSDKDGFRTYKFQLRGNGNLQHVTKLLHAYYTKPFLHRISRLDVRPASNQKDTGRLLITLESEVMSLPTSKDLQPVLKSDDSLLVKSLEDYEQSILNRNLLASENQPPRMAPTKTVEATKGLRVEYTVDAKDTNPNQSVNFAIEGEAPKGLAVDSKSGKLNWTSNDIGDYSFTIVATDSGIPVKSSKQQVTVKVKEPPPPEKPIPKFDIASQAKLTGLVSGREGPEGWVISKTEGKTLRLREGDELKLGDVVGKIVKIGATYMEVETDGKRWTIGTEESIADAFKRGQID
ncbi:MAG: cadherin repeat domain-containing protein [Pirellula sp.]